MIRNILVGAALAALLWEPAMGQDLTVLKRQGTPKSDARLPRVTVRLDAPHILAPTAFVAADGKVIPFVPERMDGATGSVAERRTCEGPDQLRPADIRKLAESIAADEGAPRDIVMAILRTEARGAGKRPRPQDSLPTIWPSEHSRGGSCDPVASIRAGIRHLNQLRLSFPERLHHLAAYRAGEQTLIEDSGVPSSSDTLRFVAEVMNDLSGGLNTAVARAGRAHPSSPSSRGIGEGDPPARIPRKEAGDQRWASGFVLNLE